MAACVKEGRPQAARVSPEILAALAIRARVDEQTHEPEGEDVWEGGAEAPPLWWVYGRWRSRRRRETRVSPL